MDKKAAPHEVRDQIMDFERDAKGKDVARSNDVIAGAYANMDTIEDSGDPDSFTRFRPYLAHFFPVFPRFLRVFTVSTRRF